jgi:transcriptional regulator with XRE-family HTH domain
MSDVPAKIAPFLVEALRRERGGKNWSIRQLAEHADVDRSHLGEIEALKRSPTVELLEKLCGALGIELSDLFVEAERRRDGKEKGRGPVAQNSAE